MEIEVLNWNKEVVSTKYLDKDIFDVSTRPDIIHRVVLWQQAKSRAGTHKTKQRNEVSGSTRKIYNQKGGGRARHASIKAPIFVGGGITFGPVVRSHSFPLNKKVRKLGLKSALSTKAREKNLILVEDAQINDIKTSAFIAKLRDIGIQCNTKVLIVDTKISDGLRLSSANLHKVNVIPEVGLNVLDIINHEKIVITSTAIDNLQRLK